MYSEVFFFVRYRCAGEFARAVFSRFPSDSQAIRKRFPSGSQAVPKRLLGDRQSIAVIDSI